MMFEEPENLWQDYDPYKDLSTDEEVLNAGCLHLVAIVLMMVVGLLLCALLGGCRSVRTVEVERVRTDTTYITKTQHDSIHVRDSIYLHEWTRGDTVYIEKTRWLTQWRDRLKTDTVYKSHTDTLRHEVATVKEVPAKLSKWQSFRLQLANILLLLLGVGTAVSVLRRIKI